MEIHSHGIIGLQWSDFNHFGTYYGVLEYARSIFVLSSLSEIWKVFKFDIVPAKGWQVLINCGQWPTTGGPDTRYSFPKSPTKRVPIT